MTRTIMTIETERPVASVNGAVIAGPSRGAQPHGALAGATAVTGRAQSASGLDRRSTSSRSRPANASIVRPRRS